MSEKIIREQIKQLTIQIITPKERGTGVLIRYQKRLYILTVNHVIYGKKEIKENIEIDDIELFFYNQAELYVIGIKRIGELILLEVDPQKLPLSNFEIVIFAIAPKKTKCKISFLIQAR